MKHIQSNSKSLIQNDEFIVRCFSQAKYKFVWSSKEIESYPKVIAFAVHLTKDYFALCDDKNEHVDENDIGCVWLEANNRPQEFFGLYIKERHFSDLNSLYKEFREQYHYLTSGDVSGFPINTSKESFLEALIKTGVPENIAKENFEFFLSFKRRITRFETLVNKSLNRRRKVSLKKRFAVLKRDSRRCQICGRRAPEVELTVDHKVPVRDGGSNDLPNLWTLCRDCNTGKGTITLLDEILGNIEK